MLIVQTGVHNLAAGAGSLSESFQVPPKQKCAGTSCQSSHDYAGLPNNMCIPTSARVQTAGSQQRGAQGGQEKSQNLNLGSPS